MKIKKHFSYKKIAAEIYENGYEYSFKKYLLSLGAAMLILAAVGLIYQLIPECILIVECAGVLCIPVLVRTYYSCLNRMRRFNDVDIYIHQMLYSFQRQPKINLALEDTAKVVGENMEKIIKKAREKLDYGYSDNIYAEALAIIEREYQCARIVTLHKFLIRIEQKGGRYHTALSVLLTDFDQWVKGVYKHQEEIKYMKKNSAVGIMLSFSLASVSIIIALMLKHMATIRIDITQEALYQGISALFIIVNIIYFTFVQVNYNYNWLDHERSHRAIKRDYLMAFHTDLSALKRQAVPIYLLFLLMAVVLFIIQLYLWAMFCIVTVGYLLILPNINKKKAVQRLKTDVYHAFSEWLRDVALNLQDEPLQAAIEDTYDRCPYVLKESLEKFIYEIEENPSEVTPYYEFLQEFHLLDISSTVKVLYSMSEMETNNADAAINVLIQRNYELIDRNDTLRMRDTMSMMKFGEYIPAFFVSIKVAGDMLLIVTKYL